MFEINFSDLVVLCEVLGCVVDVVWVWIECYDIKGCIVMLKLCYVDFYMIMWVKLFVYVVGDKVVFLVIGLDLFVV